MIYQLLEASSQVGNRHQAALYVLWRVADAAKDTQVQSGMLLSDFTLNLVVVGRQPYPDPNFASHVPSGHPQRLAGCLLLAVALPHAA